MRKLEKRIAVLEVCTVGVTLPIQNEAYSRIFSELRNALLERAGTSSLPPGQKGYKVDGYPTEPSFEELICGLWERMQNGAMSDNDRRVLSAMSTDDLHIVGMSATDVVTLYKRIFDEY